MIKCQCIHIYQQLNLNYKLSEQKNRHRIMDMERVLMIARWEDAAGE